MILDLCLQCLSYLNKTNIGVLRAIVIDNRRNRRESLESVIQDGRHWLKKLREGRVDKSDSFDEYYVLKIGNTLHQYSKDWNGYYDFLTKAAVHSQDQGVENGDYRDLLAQVRALSLQYEQEFNKEIAFELIHKIYSALERRIN